MNRIDSSQHSLSFLSRWIGSQFFWPAVIVCGILVKVLFFVECHQNDLLALNQLRAMDMEKFLNWSRVIVEEGRLLSDFSTEVNVSPAPVVNQGFHQSPLYPYFMAGVYFLTGQDPSYGPGELGYRVIVIVQQIMGMLLLWPFYTISLQLMSKKAARFLVVLFLFCEVMHFSEMILLRSFLLSFVYLFSLSSLLELRKKKTLSRALGTGIWLGVAFVAKPNFIAIVPLLLLWLVWHKPDVITWRSWWGKMGVVVIGFLMIGMLPVGRNMVLRDRAENTLKEQGMWQGENPVPLFKITSRGPYSYINGNSFHSADGPDPKFPQDILNPGMGQGIGWDFEKLHLLWYKNLFHLNSPFVQGVFEKTPGDTSWQQGFGGLWTTMRLVWAEHSEHNSWWTRFWPMMGNKVMAFANGLETPNNANLNIYREFSQVMSVFFVSSTWIVLFFLLGLIVLFPQWKKPEISLLFGFIFIYAAITISFYFISRFRVPVIPLMFLVGGAGVFKVVELWARKKWATRGLLLVGVIACGAVAWPRDVRGGIHQEKYEKLHGIRYADYYNYALGRRILEKPREAYEITRVGVEKPGALVFFPLLRVHFWALSQLPNHEQEKLLFCKELEKLYRGQHADSIYQKNGRDFFLTRMDHAALYTLALDQLILSEPNNDRANRLQELNLAYKVFGVQKLYELRYSVVYNNELAIPQHVKK